MAVEHVTFWTPGALNGLAPADHIAIPKPKVIEADYERRLGALCQYGLSKADENWAVLGVNSRVPAAIDPTILPPDPFRIGDTHSSANDALKGAQVGFEAAQRQGLSYPDTFRVARLAVAGSDAIIVSYFQHSTADF